MASLWGTVLPASENFDSERFFARCGVLVLLLGILVGYVLARWEAEQSYWHRVSSIVYSYFQYRQGNQPQLLEATSSFSVPMLTAAMWQLAQRALGAECQLSWQLSLVAEYES